MEPKDTPLIRPPERRNASAWFYGIGAALAVLTILLVLFGIPGPRLGDRPSPADPPAASPMQ